MSQPFTMKSLLEKDSELYSLPEIFQSASELLDDENSTSKQIGKVIEADPSLTTKILKMVNSSLYGFQSHISSTHQAVSILGKDRLREVLMGITVCNTFAYSKKTFIPIHEHWHHSFKTAILAKLLCEQSSLSPKSETLFTAGLLHEIGYLIITKIMPQVAIKIKDRGIEEDISLIQIEKEEIGFSRYEIGAAFIKEWGLPEILYEIIKNHQNPVNLSEYIHESDIVYAACELSDLETPLLESEYSSVVKKINCWDELGITYAQASDCCLIANEQVVEVMSSLGIFEHSRIV